MDFPFADTFLQHHYLYVSCWLKSEQKKQPLDECGATAKIMFE